MATGTERRKASVAADSVTSSVTPGCVKQIERHVQAGADRMADAFENVIEPVPERPIVCGVYIWSK